MLHDVEFANRLKKIQARFVARVTEWGPRVVVIRDDLEAGLYSRRELEQLRSQAHKIAGSAKNFGFADFGSAAADLEACIDHVLHVGKLEREILEQLLFVTNCFVEGLQATIATASQPALGSAKRMISAAASLSSPVLPENCAAYTHTKHTPAARILIVDDDELSRAYLIAGLAATGWSFAEAENGTDMIRSLVDQDAKTSGGRPDLIILDVDMPDIDGYTALGMIKESPELEGIPVMMLTAVNTEMGFIRSIARGAQEYLTKPVELGKLSSTISDMLRRSQQN